MNREAKAKVRLMAAWWEARPFITVDSLPTGRIFAKGMFETSMYDWLTPAQMRLAVRYWRRYGTPEDEA